MKLEWYDFNTIYFFIYIELVILQATARTVNGNDWRL